jgi:hypothetical protein
MQSGECGKVLFLTPFLGGPWEGTGRTLKWDRQAGSSGRGAGCTGCMQGRCRVVDRDHEDTQKCKAGTTLEGAFGRFRTRQRLPVAVKVCGVAERGTEGIIQP